MLQPNHQPEKLSASPDTHVAPFLNDPEIAAGIASTKDVLDGYFQQCEAAGMKVLPVVDGMTENGTYVVGARVYDAHYPERTPRDTLGTLGAWVVAAERVDADAVVFMFTAQEAASHDPRTLTPVRVVSQKDFRGTSLIYLENPEDPIGITPDQLEANPELWDVYDARVEETALLLRAPGAHGQDAGQLPTLSRAPIYPCN